MVTSFVASVSDRKLRLLVHQPVDLGFDAVVGELTGDHLGVGFLYARHGPEVEELLDPSHRGGPKGPLKRPYTNGFLEKMQNVKNFSLYFS